MLDKLFVSNSTSHLITCHKVVVCTTHQHACDTIPENYIVTVRPPTQAFTSLLIGMPDLNTSSSSLFGMHHQCVAPLAANSPHSGLSRAISIASSKVRLSRDRSFFRVAIQEEWGRPTGLLQSLWGSAVRIL